MQISFIGSVGIPNRYGGFESFLEHCAPFIAKRGIPTIVTCDAFCYQDDTLPFFNGVERIFIKIPANGWASIFHDLVAFFSVLRSSSHIVILGVSGGPWFPIFRLACILTGKKMAVNIDGVEWRRSKFSRGKRLILRLFDFFAQRFSHHVIYDNRGLQEFLSACSLEKSTCIAYPGDHVKRLDGVTKCPGTALTICRIEPENNLEILIQGFLQSNLIKYTIVGNWGRSSYARSLRSRYINHERLEILDPIYDAEKLAKLRGQCSYYLHGHSVGGTNPSLVEMLFYDCCIACFDVSFNHFTAESCASYFSSADELSQILNEDNFPSNDSLRNTLRTRYSANHISDAYIDTLTS